MRKLLHIKDFYLKNIETEKSNSSYAFSKHCKSLNPVSQRSEPLTLLHLYRKALILSSPTIGDNFSKTTDSCTTPFFKIPILSKKQIPKHFMAVEGLTKSWLSNLKASFSETFSCLTQ